MADLMSRHPSGFGGFLSALDFHLGPVVEVGLVLPAADGTAAEPLLATLFGRYLPNRVVAGAVEGAAVGLPLLADRRALGGQPTAYVCRRYACQLPVTDPEALARQLDGGV
jgi:uncharacterized protein YyaL (SSP411 family)